MSSTSCIFSVTSPKDSSSASSTHVHTVMVISASELPSKMNLSYHSGLRLSVLMLLFSFCSRVPSLSVILSLQNGLLEPFVFFAGNSEPLTRVTSAENISPKISLPYFSVAKSSVLISFKLLRKAKSSLESSTPSPSLSAISNSFMKMVSLNSSGMSATLNFVTSSQPNPMSALGSGFSICCLAKERKSSPSFNAFPKVDSASQVNPVSGAVPTKSQMVSQPGSGALTLSCSLIALNGKSNVLPSSKTQVTEPSAYTAVRLAS
mmetsp:Transcript_107086/g.205967  ORF Transcript_107086/g.205967 Transcript_107086/m.205967 type:complete len:263 (-) Transcript_107086:420-1208(-)